MRQDVAASARVRGSVVVDSFRASLSSFAAHVVLENTRLACAAFDLVTESWLNEAAVLVDAGGNLCGCNDEQPRKAVSAALEPPSSLDMP